MVTFNIDYNFSIFMMCISRLMKAPSMVWLQLELNFCVKIIYNSYIQQLTLTIILEFPEYLSNVDILAVIFIARFGLIFSVFHVCVKLLYACTCPLMTWVRYVIFFFNIDFNYGQMLLSHTQCFKFILI